MFAKRINCVNLPFVNEVKKTYSNIQPSPTHNYLKNI